jgi:hypothetical protein
MQVRSPEQKSGKILMTASGEVAAALPWDETLTVRPARLRLFSK